MRCIVKTFNKNKKNPFNIQFNEQARWISKRTDFYMGISLIEHASIKDVCNGVIYLDTPYRSLIDTNKNNKVFVLYQNEYVCIGRLCRQYYTYNKFLKLRRNIELINKRKKELSNIIREYKKCK
jgi:hypothetical protein